MSHKLKSLEKKKESMCKASGRLKEKSNWCQYEGFQLNKQILFFFFFFSYPAMVKCQEITPEKPRSLLRGGEELDKDPH